MSDRTTAIISALHSATLYKTLKPLIFYNENTPSPNAARMVLQGLEPRFSDSKSDVLTFIL